MSGKPLQSEDREADKGMQWKYDIVVIGAGAAGIAAAKSAFASGCRSILLIDARKQMGGVLIQCAHHGFGSGLTGPEYIEKLTVDFPEEAHLPQSFWMYGSGFLQHTVSLLPDLSP